MTRDMLRRRLIERGWFPENLLPNASNGNKLARGAYAIENKALSTLKRNSFLAFNRDLVWLL